MRTLRLGFNTAVVALLPSMAAAQGNMVDVTVKVAVNDQVIREVRREIVHAVQSIDIPNVARHVHRAIDSVIVGLGPAISIGAQDRDFRFEQTKRETKTLAIGANGSLDLRNISGNMTITAGGGRDATIDLAWRSRGRTEADAKRGLDEVTIETDHRGDRASVMTRTPNGRQPYRVSIDYTVTVPPGTHVTVATMSGTTTVTGVKGDVVVDVMSGNVRVTNSRASRVKTMSGDVTVSDVDSEVNLEVGSFSGSVTVERAKSRRLTVDAGSGNIVGRDVTADDATLKTMSGNVEFSGPLARNGRYALQTHSGTVTVTVVGNVGFELDASTFSGSVRPLGELGLKVISSNRRGLRGTVGDGSARVTATSLSGDVTIGRK